MKNRIVLISKDAFGIMNLPQYGNKFWKTPNIDKLVKNGTLFKKHYTTAPSTGMAFTSMFTGKYPYELTDRKVYTHVKRYEGTTLFDL